MARPRFDGISEARRADGQLIYRARVRTDHHGFRISSFDENEMLRPQHILLMGCSMMWGEGLNDEESLAFQLNGAQKEYSAFNRGFPGQGPIEVFLQMQRPEFVKDVAQERGIGAYFFIPNHIDRTIGTMGIFRSWGRNLHAFHFENENLVPKGPFVQEEPVRYWLLRFFSHSAIFAKFGIDLPIKREEHYVLFSQIIREIKREYLQLKPQGRFVFVFLPTNSEEVARLQPYLAQMEIEYLPYHKGPTFDQLTSEQTAIPYDGHPTQEYNRLLVKVLKTDLLGESTDR